MSNPVMAYGLPHQQWNAQDEERLMVALARLFSFAGFLPVGSEMTRVLAHTDCASKPCSRSTGWCPVCADLFGGLSHATAKWPA